MLGLLLHERLVDPHPPQRDDRHRGRGDDAVEADRVRAEQRGREQALEQDERLGAGEEDGVDGAAAGGDGAEGARRAPAGSRRGDGMGRDATRAMDDRPVLFISYAGVLGGAERVLLDCAARLPRPAVVACPEGPLAAAARGARLAVEPIPSRSLRMRGARLGAARRARRPGPRRARRRPPARARGDRRLGRRAVLRVRAAAAR